MRLELGLALTGTDMIKQSDFAQARFGPSMHGRFYAMKVCFETGLVVRNMSRNKVQWLVLLLLV